jgi:hypothetical protein
VIEQECSLVTRAALLDWQACKVYKHNPTLGSEKIALVVLLVSPSGKRLFYRFRRRLDASQSAKI